MSKPDDGPRIHNWAGNVTFTPTTLHRPTTVQQVQDVVAACSRIHALGTGHSFSKVADSPGALVSVAGLPRVIDVDSAGSTVTVSAGVRWGELAPVVHEAGFAVHTMGSLPHISVAGSIATGTHGSGDRNGCLATAVTGLQIVRPSGELRELSLGDVDLAGSVVALGGLGVVTRATLRLVPAYDVSQVVYDRLPWDRALEHLEPIMASAMSVSLFTTWRGAGFEQVWVKRRDGDGPVDLAWTGAVLADGPRHPVPGVSPEHCTQQGGVPGPWFDRVPHFRLEFNPSSGAELQTEYLVPRGHGVEALLALDSIRDRIAPVLQIAEIRTVAADDLWLSPSQGRDSLALHFTWIADTAAVAPVVEEVERALAPFGARPHWGKVFGTGPAAVAALYPRMADFRRLLEREDPNGRMRNALIDAYVRTED